ncbi:hypothetical protein ACJ41O_007150 [Fusarium nematophilum]
MTTDYDRMCEEDGDDECRAWLSRLIDAKPQIVAFVENRVGGGDTGEFIGYLKGSYNLGLRIGFSNGRGDVVIRFPKPGHTVWRAEKVENEVQVISYLKHHTTIPVPNIVDWGPVEDSPQCLGPFIIMEFIEGTRLSSILKKPTEREEDDLILDPDVDETMLDTIYEQLADYLLQLSRLEFDRIGAITKDEGEDNSWSVTRRPLTYNMNELATATQHPRDTFPSKPLDSATEFFQSAASDHLIHLETHRNLAKNTEDARRRFIARHRFQQLVSKFCIEDQGPFRLFCDDLQPSNMLINPETLQIVAVLDWEFTNAMPAQFAYDPPWWLLLLGPDMWLERHTVEEFLSRYVPRMEQFLQALERVEARSGAGPQDTRLSPRMRDSWDTGRFWFNYAARKSMDVDAVYWKTLHEDGAGLEMLDDAIRAQMEPFVEMKMQQLGEYRKEYAERFG